MNLAAPPAPQRWPFAAAHEAPQALLAEHPHSPPPALQCPAARALLPVRVPPPKRTLRLGDHQLLLRGALAVLRGVAERCQGGVTCCELLLQTAALGLPMLLCST